MSYKFQLRILFTLLPNFTTCIHIHKRRVFKEYEYENHKNANENEKGPLFHLRSLIFDFHSYVANGGKGSLS